MITEEQINVLSDAELSSLWKETEKDRHIKPGPSDLMNYIKTYTGRIIPYKSICPGHSAPFDIFLEILYGSSDILVLANRTGGKTASAGLCAGLLAYHFGADITILGGSGQQSTRVYEEMVNFLELGFEDQVKGDILKTGVAFKTGNKVNMLTQSSTSVRGPHPPIVIADEIDEFDPNILAAAKSIPKSDEKRGIKAKFIELSTRHNSGGIMEKEWNNPKAIYRKKFIWCVWEVMAPCTEDYSCSRCPLVEAGCPGKKLMSQAVGYLSIEDIQKAFSRMPEDTWKSEWTCRQPRRSGLVYANFDKILCCTSTYYKPSLAIWRSCDYGIDNETVVQYYQVDGMGRAWGINEFRWSGVPPSVIVKEMLKLEEKEKYEKFGGTIVDPSAASFRKEIEEAGRQMGRHNARIKGIHVTLGANNDVDEGIAEMRNALVPLDDGKTSIMFDAIKMEKTIEEFESYSLRNGRPVKEDDHGMDAARYFVATCPSFNRKGNPILFLGEID